MNGMIKIKPSGGGYKFYKVNGDDAIIIHYLLKYKIRDYKTIIFPQEALEKVTKTLEQNRVSYEVLHSNSFDSDFNNYESIKSKAYEALDKETRIEILITKINKLSGIRLNKFLEYLESYPYE